MPINRFCKCCSNIRVASISFINKYLTLNFIVGFLFGDWDRSSLFFGFLFSWTIIITIIVANYIIDGQTDVPEPRTENGERDMQMRYGNRGPRWSKGIFGWSCNFIEPGFWRATEWQRCIRLHYKWLAFIIYLFVLENCTLRITKNGVWINK